MSAEDKVDFSKALYIKLGKGGSWEKESLEKGILRIGYNETPFDAARAGDWDTVWEAWRGMRSDDGTATRDLKQIRNFFEEGEKTVWIIFSSGLLWWCFAKPGVEKHPDKRGTYRESLGGWRSKDLKGKLLSAENLSGNLLSVQGFRGTLCDVKAFDYLKRRLNGNVLPEVEAAARAQAQMIDKILPMMQLLTWQDFELLVDLIFASSGWRRIGQVGKTQETVDLELMLPTTGERAFVQIKSSAGRQQLADYLARFETSGLYDKMFFVWHSGDVGSVTDAENATVTLLGPEVLARMVFDAGLTSWLLDKVS